MTFNPREKKFKAWDTRRKKWAYTEDKPHCSQYFLVESMIYHSPKDLIWLECAYTTPNGIEAWEGDIFEYEFTNYSKTETKRWVVEYEDGRYYHPYKLYGTLHFNHIDTIRKIGNVYDNPELTPQ